MKMEGLLVKHKTLGTGTITKFDGKFLTVSFETKVSMFQFPAAFTTFIQAADPADQTAILQEIENAKAAVIEQQKASEEAKRAEIENETPVKKTAHKSISTPKKAADKQERIAGKPMTFYVFQGSTFDREYQGGYLWAPITNKSGDTFHHWNRLLDVRPGDVILHGYNGHVQAVSIARAACYDCIQPKELQTEDSWDLQGRRLDTDYIMLKTPIRTSNYTEDIIRLCNTKYAPFNRMGTGNMGYLFEINREMAKIFLNAATTANPYLKGNQTITELLAE
jgi:hypothetical protein